MSHEKTDTELHQEVLAGSEAKYILNHPQFNGAFVAVRNSVISQMRQVKPRDREMHSELIRRLQTVDAVEKALREVIRTGDQAEAEIKHKKSLAEMAAAAAERIFSRN